jgi:glycosyltransferase involved in cell wall biosynthesis
MAENLPTVLQHVNPAASASFSNSGRRVGILIVAYNAVTTLGQVLKRIPAEVIQNVEEIVVFDDASRDDTTELAIGYKVKNDFSKLTIIKNEKNLGYGGNQKKGYAYFMRKNFDVVILLHGDGQYPPEMLAAMYSPIVEGRADAVFGSRMMKTYGGPIKGGMPLYKYAGNRILTRFENRALAMNLTEFHSGYRAYNLHALEQIDMSEMTDDFHFDTEIIIKLNHQRFRILEIPIPTYYGNEICYVNGFKYARDVYKAVRRYHQTVQSLRRWPEFSEYYVHYPIKDSRYSSHHWIVKLAGTNNRILDVACGEGYLAKNLKENGNTVCGVDVLKEPALRDVFDAYYAMDLDSTHSSIKDRLGDRKFDVIVLGDILEHLKHGQQLLRDCADLLAPNGCMIISLPNVANLHVRLQVLFGRFNYTDRGILDKTHLRFYTLRTARKFIEDQNLSIVRRHSTIVPLDLALGVSPKNWTLGPARWCLNLATAVFPSLLGYQHIFVATKKS